MIALRALYVVDEPTGTVVFSRTFTAVEHRCRVLVEQSNVKADKERNPALHKLHYAPLPTHDALVRALRSARTSPLAPQGMLVLEVDDVWPVIQQPRTIAERFCLVAIPLVQHINTVPKGGKGTESGATASSFSSEAAAAAAAAAFTASCSMGTPASLPQHVRRSPPPQGSRTPMSPVDATPAAVPSTTNLRSKRHPHLLHLPCVTATFVILDEISAALARFLSAAGPSAGSTGAGQGTPCNPTGVRQQSHGGSHPVSWVIMLSQYIGRNYPFGSPLALSKEASGNFEELCATATSRAIVAQSLEAAALFGTGRGTGGSAGGCLASQLSGGGGGSGVEGSASTPTADSGTPGGSAVQSRRKPSLFRSQPAVGDPSVAMVLSLVDVVSGQIYGRNDITDICYFTKSIHCSGNPPNNHASTTSTTESGLPEDRATQVFQQAAPPVVDVQVVVNHTEAVSAYIAHPAVRAVHHQEVVAPATKQQPATCSQGCVVTFTAGAHPFYPLAMVHRHPSAAFLPFTGVLRVDVSPAERNSITLVLDITPQHVDRLKNTEAAHFHVQIVLPSLTVPIVSDTLVASTGSVVVTRSNALQWSIPFKSKKDRTQPIELSGKLTTRGTITQGFAAVQDATASLDFKLLNTCIPYSAPSDVHTSGMGSPEGTGGSVTSTPVGQHPPGQPLSGGTVASHTEVAVSLDRRPSMIRGSATTVSRPPTLLTGAITASSPIRSRPPEMSSGNQESSASGGSGASGTGGANQGTSVMTPVLMDDASVTRHAGDAGMGLQGDSGTDMFGSDDVGFKVVVSPVTCVQTATDDPYVIYNALAPGLHALSQRQKV